MDCMGRNDPDGRISLPKKQHDLVTDLLRRWKDSGLIDETMEAKLSESVSVSAFDWRKTARYAFIISISCLVIAVGALLADEMLLKLLMRLFRAPDLAKCALFALLSAAAFRKGLGLRKKQPHRTYGNEALFCRGVLAVAAAIFYVGAAIDTGTMHYSVLLLLASILYSLLGLWFPSPLVWVFGLLSLGAWMGTETGYVSGFGMYYLGMNYPLRFVIFGGALSAIGIAGEHFLPGPDPGSGAFRDRLLSVSPQTKVIGLLYLFIALWIMSIFGNYGDVAEWLQVRQYQLFHWSIIFGAAAAAAVWFGLKRDDGALRGFGMTFLFINLYTRYFEYFWPLLHKAVFFSILAASFWFIGSRAERIRNFGRGRPLDRQKS